MKNDASGSPTAATTSRRNSGPSKATLCSSTRSGIACRSPYVVSTLARLGRIAHGLCEVEVGGRLLDQSAVDVLAHRHHEGLVLRHQHREAVGGRDDVVVHQPDPVEALLVGRPHSRPEAARAAGVGLEVDALEVEPAVGVEHLAGVVLAGVVDHDHRVGLVGLAGQAVEGAGRAGRRGCR